MDKNSDNQSTKTPVNGRGQIVQLLKILPLNEKNNLLKKMKILDPSLTEELQREGLSFSSVFEVQQLLISRTCAEIHPDIWAMALVDEHVEHQKILLRKMPESYAQKVYTRLKNINPSLKDIKRAKDKITTVLSMSKYDYL